MTWTLEDLDDDDLRRKLTKLAEHMAKKDCDSAVEYRTAWGPLVIKFGGEYDLGS